MELKEIAPYLAYGLNTNEGVLVGLTNWVGWCGVFKDTQGERHVPISAIKPIFRPLSDLVKPCLEGGKIPIVELAKIAYGNIFHINEDFTSEEVLSENENFGLIAFYDKERVSFTVQKECRWFEFCFYVDGSELHLNQLTLFQWMFEHHFDVFGLIEKGQAIYTDTTTC